ncbi:MAG: Magnesium transport protein CorA [Acidobacteria bacterium]|nr:Magnesium transport protein CorA [Acidobacteriota bacterium]
MDIFVYRDGANQVEEGFTDEQIPELLADEKTIFWVDMESPSEADDHLLLDVFHFHPLTVEDCRANRHHPKVEEFPDYIYFIVHAVRTDASSDRFNTVELDGFLGRNYVVTYHHDSFTSIDKVKQTIRSSPVTCQRGAPFLLHSIIDSIVDDYLPVMDDFDERINDLEDNIFTLRRPNDEILEEILGLKRSVLRLRRISSKQLEVLYRISHGQFQLISGPVLPFFRDIYDHLVRVSDLAESYRDLISGSLEAYLSVVSNRLNEIMKVLTIFSAIMLPLTFIAGVYGMNFDNMPELHSRYGYYTVWVIMLVVAVGMLGLFWKRGWIGKGQPKRRRRKEEGHGVGETR